MSKHPFKRKMQLNSNNMNATISAANYNEYFVDPKTGKHTQLEHPFLKTAFIKVNHPFRRVFKGEPALRAIANTLLGHFRVK